MEKLKKDRQKLKDKKRQKAKNDKLRAQKLAEKGSKNVTVRNQTMLIQDAPVDFDDFEQGIGEDRGKSPMKNFMSNVGKTKRSEHLIKKSDVNETP